MKTLILAEECEWNPEMNRAKYEGESCHNQAVFVLGNGKWHLCQYCADLENFKRFKKKPLRSVA